MAHSYSTDSVERRRIPFFLAAAAIASSYAVFYCLNRFNVNLQWWVALPIDTMGFYGLYYLLFDKIIWKWRALYRLGIICIPDLNGMREGEIHSSHRVDGAEDGIRIPISVEIHQTWTEILLAGTTERSKSCSLWAALMTEHPKALNYEYRNEPMAGAVDSMHTHRGTAELRIGSDRQSLEGEYYSGRDRQNVGTISLQRVRQ